jgi:hypothetical protein
MKSGDLLWGLALAGSAALLGIPASQEAFVAFTTGHPYLAGFLKFAWLATLGELLALRIGAGRWALPGALGARALIWGLLGISITLAFTVFTEGTRGAMQRGLLPEGAGPLGLAFFTSALMNLTFGPVLMGTHRFTDTWLDMRCEGLTRTCVADVARRIDWVGFCDFVILKTIPIFWIPAHTAVFLLPAEFRVVAAAFLSVALGGILAFAKKSRSGPTQAPSAAISSQA